MKWIDLLKTGLKRSADKISKGISDIFYSKKIDKQTIAELEELLISSDLGIDTAEYITQLLAQKSFSEEATEKEIKQELANILFEILKTSEGELNFNKGKPNIVLVCGVNGNGKTTTIGKLASQAALNGQQVMLAACDTFRAAAESQLQIWADRTGSQFVSGESNSDPASVAYKAIELAQRQNIDLLLIDTAGRLTNKTNLMDELSKIDRVIKKIDPSLPHDTVLVLDATTGQHALTQVEAFREKVNVSGIIVTKLDGSSKAGVIVAIAHKFKLPILAIGVGESVDSLHKFNAHQFAERLVGL